MKLKRDTADAAFSDAIRERDGWQCRNCGGQSDIQCAHIISRKFSRTRTDPSNAIALCASCHTHFTQDEFLWVDWCVEKFGRAYIDELRLKRHELLRRSKNYVKECAKHFRKESERMRLLRMDGDQNPRLESYDGELPDRLRKAGM